MNRNVSFLLGAILLVFAYGLLFVLGPDAADAYVKEDRVVEWIGATALLATSIFFLLILLRGRKAARFGGPMQLVLLGLAILFFIGAGEEISWGQRILGFSTPQEIAETNAQGELNLHNNEIIEGWINAERMFQIFWVSFGVLLPLAAAVSQRFRATVKRFLPVLPLWVAIFLIANQVVANLSGAFNDAHPDLYAGHYYDYSHAQVEVTESTVSVIFALGALALLRAFTIAWSDRHGESTPEEGTIG